MPPGLTEPWASPDGDTILTTGFCHLNLTPCHVLKAVKCIHLQWIMNEIRIKMEHENRRNPIFSTLNIDIHVVLTYQLRHRLHNDSTRRTSLLLSRTLLWVFYYTKNSRTQNLLFAWFFVTVSLELSEVWQHVYRGLAAGTHLCWRHRPWLACINRTVHSFLCCPASASAP